MYPSLGNLKSPLITMQYELQRGNTIFKSLACAISPAAPTQLKWINQTFENQF